MATRCCFMILPMHLIMFIDTYICACRPILSQVCRYFRSHLHFQHVTARSSRTFSYVCTIVPYIRLLRIDLGSRVSRGDLWEHGCVHTQLVDEMHVVTAYERFNFRMYSNVINIVRQACCKRLRWLSSSVPQNPGQMAALSNEVLCIPSLQDVYIDCSWCNLGPRHINKIVRTPSASRIRLLTLDLSFNFVFDLQPLQKMQHMPHITCLCIILHNACTVDESNVRDFLQTTHIECIVIKIAIIIGNHIVTKKE